jgi:hypothetical protein
MKKYFNVLLLSVACVLLVGSCNKDVTSASSSSLESTLSKDAAFSDVLKSAADLGMKLNITSLSNESNMAELQVIAAKINTKSASSADYKRVQEITGVTYNDFVASLQKFGTSLNTLNTKYPELGKMKQQELSALFTKAIQTNPALQSFVANPTGEVMKTAGCPLRDICNLAVVLTKLFAGDTICTAISVSTIPVIGGILCQLILTLGVGILTGICNALPC